MKNNIIDVTDAINIFYDAVMTRITSWPKSTLYGLYNKRHLSEVERDLAASIGENFKKNEKEIKIMFAVELFLASGCSLTDKQLEELTKQAREQDGIIPTISSSSVGRYLTSDEVAMLFGNRIADEIKYHRTKHKEDAPLKGGLESAKNFSSSTLSEKEIKEIIIAMANYYLEGLTYYEIADRINETYHTSYDYQDVRHTLMLKLKRYDEGLFYDVKDKREQNERAVITKRKEIILQMYHMYIDSNKTFLEIAREFNVDESRVSVRLSTRSLKDLMIEFPEEVTEEMIQKVEAKKKINMGNKRKVTAIIPAEAIDTLFPLEDEATSSSGNQVR